MRTFTGSWGNRLTLCFLLVIACSTIYFGIAAILLPGRQPVLYTGSSLFFLMGGGIGGMALLGLLESFTKYDVDAEGITRRAWNGTQRMRWSDISHLKENGQKDGSLTFTDSMGRKLTAHLALLKTAEQAEMRSLLDPYLAPLRERQQRDVSLPGQVYYPSRTGVWAGVVMIALTGIAGGIFLSMPVPADQRGYFYGIVGFLAVCGLFSGLLAVACITDSLMLTEQTIVCRRWFRTQALPFHQVTSVMSRMQYYKGSSWEVTTVEGDGKKILLTSKMPDYPILLAFIRAHISKEAQERGTAAAVEITKKQEKTSRIALPIAALVYGLLFLGLGLWFLHTGNERLADYLLMDKEGRETVGQITGTQLGESKSARYLLSFAFGVGAAEITSSSPVSYEDYQTARIGAPVRVIYVPNHPHICRTVQSIGRRSAEGNIRLGMMNLVFACVLPPLLILIPYLKKKKESTDPSKASMPT